MVQFFSKSANITPERVEQHVTEACYTKKAPRTTAATAGSAPRIHATQETDQQADRVFSRSEELWTVSQKMTGSAFATAAVSTSVSGIHNFSQQIKVLVDTGSLLSIGLCVSESFFLSLGEKLGDLLPPSFQRANGVSENSGMHTLGDTVVNIKCSNFNNIILSGPATVLRNLSQQVIVGMNFLQDNYLNLDLTPDHAHLIHPPTQEYQVLVMQISEPCPFPQRSRSEKIMKGVGTGSKRLFGVHPLNRIKWI